MVQDWVLVQAWSWFNTGLGSRLVEGLYQLEREIALKVHQSLNVKSPESGKEKTGSPESRHLKICRTSGPDVMSG